MSACLAGRTYGGKALCHQHDRAHASVGIIRFINNSLITYCSGACQHVFSAANMGLVESRLTGGGEEWYLRFAGKARQKDKPEGGAWIGRKISSREIGRAHV